MLHLQLEPDVDPVALWAIVEGFDESVITPEERSFVMHMLLKPNAALTCSRRLSRKRCVFHILHARDIYLVRREK